MGEAKYFGSTFTGAMPALNTGWRSSSHAGPHNRTKNKSLTRRLFEIQFRFLNGRIFVQRSLNNVFECDSWRAGQDGKAPGDYKQHW
jgi:hypothetical protein